MGVMSDQTSHHWRTHDGIAVAGMGVALPGAALTSADLITLLESRFDLRLRRQARAVTRRLGIETRFFSRDFASRLECPRPQDSNPQLSARAINEALAQAQITINDVRFMIGHTATPSTALPPNISQVAELLNYRGPFVELRQACTGFASALTLANGLLQAKDAGAVVIVGSEVGSPFFDPLRAAEDSGQLVNLLMMGDAAAAIVLLPAAHPAVQKKNLGSISKMFYGQDGVNKSPGLSLRAGSSNCSESSSLVFEFEHDFAAVRRHGPALFQRGLEAAELLGIKGCDVDWLVPHQANGRMHELLSVHLDIPRERIFVNADRVGNTGSAAIWLALAQLRSTLRQGQRALILGAEATKYMYGGFLYTHG